MCNEAYKMFYNYSTKIYGIFCVFLEQRKNTTASFQNIKMNSKDNRQ